MHEQISKRFKSVCLGLRLPCEWRVTFVGALAAVGAGRARRRRRLRPRVGKPRVRLHLVEKYISAFVYLYMQSYNNWYSLLLRSPTTGSAAEALPIWCLA